MWLTYDRRKVRTSFGVNKRPNSVNVESEENIIPMVHGQPYTAPLQHTGENKTE